MHEMYILKFNYVYLYAKQGILSVTSWVDIAMSVCPSDCPFVYPSICIYVN